jgi:hypothetical protein
MMMKRYFTGIICFLAFVPGAYSQSVSFLNVPSDVRIAGMGNAGYALPVTHATCYNTAALLYADPKMAAAVSYVRWQPEALNSQLVHAAAYIRRNKWGIAAGFRHNTFAAIQKTDEQGNLTGAFSPSEYALDIGFAYKVVDRIGVAVTLRHISSDMGGPSKGAAFAGDVSLLYKQKNLHVGLGCANIGSAIDYGYSAYSLPARIKAGAAYQLSFQDTHHLTGSLDVAYQLPSNYSGMLGSIGAEYSYKHRLALRAGYHAADGQTTGSSYASLGCGAAFWGAELNFAYLLAQASSPVRQTLLISLGWRL